MSWPRIVLAVLVVATALEVAPVAMNHYWLLSAECSEGSQFQREDMASMVEKYPLLMARFAQQVTETTALGALGPTLRLVWETNSLVRAVSGMAHWCANNIFVRIFSPTTPIEYALMLGFVVLMLFIGSNLLSHYYYARVYSGGNTRRGKKSAKGELADGEAW